MNATEELAKAARALLDAIRSGDTVVIKASEWPSKRRVPPRIAIIDREAPEKPVDRRIRGKVTSAAARLREALLNFEAAERAKGGR